MTLKDVAEKAGVSVSTVSRVIASSNEKCASEEVKKRIWKAVQETGYRPNQSAQALRKGAPGQNECAASICCLFARSKDFASDRYFEELSGYVKQEIMRQGYRLGKQFAQHDAQEVVTGNYRPGKRDGLVVMGRTQDALAPLISLFGKRVVYITLNQMHIAADHVMCDGRQATEIAMRYLYSNGHRKIAYIGEYKGEIRYKSYAEFLAQNNLQLQWGHIVFAEMNAEGGYAAAKELLKRSTRPTAIFCANDVTAIGVLARLKDSGVRVPQDISVISIDNIRDASLCSPGLTTVSIPLRDLGTFAVKTLADRIQHGHTFPLSIFMPPELVIRGSVQPL